MVAGMFAGQLLLDLVPLELQGGSWHSIRSITGKFVTVGSALCFFDFADRTVMPWLSIREVLEAKGIWKEGKPMHDMRPYVVVGWFTIACACIVGFAWGGAH